MEYKIAICDDEQKDRDFVAALSCRWAGQRGNTVELTEFSSAEQFLFCYGEQSDYDILLLDIEMGQMDGVQLAKQLRQKNETIQIVFVTGYSDYISEGYEVAALHYLMKPVDAAKLFAVLDRAAEKLRRNEKFLTLELSGETVRLPVYQIRCAEVQGNYVTVHARADYTVKMTLSELETRLDDNFFRLGRSALVNLGCVARVTRTAVTLTDGSTLPLPRGAYERINRAIINRG